MKQNSRFFTIATAAPSCRNKDFKKLVYLRTDVYGQVRNLQSPEVKKSKKKSPVKSRMHFKNLHLTFCDKGKNDEQIDNQIKIRKQILRERQLENMKNMQRSSSCNTRKLQPIRKQSQQNSSKKKLRSQANLEKLNVSFQMPNKNGVGRGSFNSTLLPKSIRKSRVSKMDTEASSKHNYVAQSLGREYVNLGVIRQHYQTEKIIEETPMRNQSLDYSQMNIYEGSRNTSIHLQSIKVQDSRFQERIPRNSESKRTSLKSDFLTIQHEQPIAKKKFLLSGHPHITEEISPIYQEFFKLHNTTDSIHNSIRTSIAEPSKLILVQNSICDSLDMTPKVSDYQGIPKSPIYTLQIDEIQDFYIEIEPVTTKLTMEPNLKEFENKI